MGDSGFPTSPDALTSEWLTGVLRESGVLSQTDSVAAFECKFIGDGKMGDNARIALRYTRDGGSAPRNVIAKLPARDETARIMAGARGAYYNEVMFYRQLAPRARLNTPVIYHAAVSEDRSDFIILMQDMAPAVPGDQIAGESRQRTEMALAQAAKLAAAFYGDERVAESDYVMTTARDDGGKMGEELLQQYWPAFVDRFGHGLAADCIAFGERYVDHHARFVSRYSGSKTLAHGDFRSENLLFTESSATAVDWQTVCESSALTDAAYFLGGSIAIEARREWERALIEFYRMCLDAEGVALPANECWDQYREYAMHGLLILILGACFSEPDPRGERMFLAMAQRHLQQCVDLDSAEFL